MSNHLRILQVGTGFASIPPKGAYSVEHVTHAISTHLTEIGHRVTLLDIADGDRPATGYEVSTVKRGLQHNKGFVSHVSQGLLFGFLVSRALRGLLSQRTFDVVQFHNQFSGAMGIPVAKDRGVPTAYWVHNPEWSDPSQYSRWLVRLKFHLERSAIRSADIVICGTHCIARNVAKQLDIPDSKLAVIPQGLTEEWFGRSEPNARVKPSLDNVVLNVARIAPYKNQAALARAIPRVVAQVPSARFIFAGPVDDRVYYSKVVNILRSSGSLDHATFLGEVPRENLPPLYAKASVFAFPTRAETTGMVVLEAVSQGVPVVASDIPPIRELFPEGYVTFVPSEDDRIMAEAIVTLLRDREKAQQLSLSAWQQCSDQYRWSSVLPKLIELYSQLAHKVT